MVSGFVAFEVVWCLDIKIIANSSPKDNVNIQDQMQALGQKYLGVRTGEHMNELFRDNQVHTEGGHKVLIDNFLNAQCEYPAL